MQDVTFSLSADVTVSRGRKRKSGFVRALVTWWDVRQGR